MCLPTQQVQMKVVAFSEGYIQFVDRSAKRISFVFHIARVGNKDTKVTLLLSHDITTKDYTFLIEDKVIRRYQRKRQMTRGMTICLWYEDVMCVLGI